MSGPQERQSGGADGESSNHVGDVRAWLAVEHRHPPSTAAAVLALAVVLAQYASWLTADLGVGSAAFVLVAAGAAYSLYRQPTLRAVAVVGLYALGALVASTPVFMNLPFLLSAGAYGVANPTAFTMRLSDLVFLLAFGLLGVVPAGVAWGLSRR